MSKVKLKDISIRISSGLTPLRSNFSFWNSQDIPWVKTEQLGTKNIFDSNEKVSYLALKDTSLRLYPKNTISIAMYGEGKTRGSVSILKNEMATNQACCNVELDFKKADYEYVYYYLSTQYHELRNLSSGIRKNLNSNDIKSYSIWLPDLPTQQKIAAVLSALDDKIELNNKINAELEAMAKTLYEYWFVQFEFPVTSTSSVTGKSTSSVTAPVVESVETTDTVAEPVSVVEPVETTDMVAEPVAVVEPVETTDTVAEPVSMVEPVETTDMVAERSRSYKSSGGKMVYNKTLKREIPEGWEVKNLYEIADFINGLACQKFRPKNDEDDFLPVIKIREMKDGVSDNTEKVKVDIPEKNIINDGDVLFSWSASLEVDIWTGGKAGLNQHIFKVISNEFPRSFYYFEIRNYLQHFKMMADLRKTTMGHITIDHLKSSFIAIPSYNLIKKLDDKIEPILQKVILSKKQNQELAALRDWLLPMLMNGQVKVEGVSGNMVEQLGMVAEESGKYRH